MSGIKYGRYAVFSGSDYYPEGGWMDYRNSFNTVEEASAYGKGLKEGGDSDWFHVVDMRERVVLSPSRLS